MHHFRRFGIAAGIMCLFYTVSNTALEIINERKFDKEVDRKLREGEYGDSRD